MNLKLARIAEAETKNNYHGNTLAAIGNLQVLREHFPPSVTVEDLEGDWSGAFAYHCAVLAGSSLPPKYPDPRVRGCFNLVSSWWEYARLPKIRILHSPAELPEVGDLAVFRLSSEKPPMIGIVLSVGEGSVELAMGDYHNHSAIAERPLNELMEGFIRLER
ncbi:MAG: hypothetical protein E7620_01075 [Ruminococcaceae bacterium]|nr:hypothetical protein [Oscillospiraceae bacterium]